MAAKEKHRPKLLSLQLSGWKSIRALDPPLLLKDLNVFIGANGAGKSNLVAFFRMLNRMIAGHLQDYIGVSGGAETHLFLGSKKTSKIEATLSFDSRDGVNRYFLRLMQAAGDKLIFSEERLEFDRTGKEGTKVDVLGGGYDESVLRQKWLEEKTAAAEAHKERKKAKRIASVTYHLLKNCRVFHFHDTSDTSPMRRPCYLNDNHFLRPDGANLAAMLYFYRERHAVVYRRIVSTLRKIVPGFDDFSLEPDRLNPNNIRLNWERAGVEYIFGPHQFSDGSLRAIALVTLLLQPEVELPKAIVLDEPELGLHPYALELISGLFRAASLHSQIILATQSESFLNYFEPEEIIVTDCAGGETQFRRLTSDELEEWRDEYTLGELWHRNVLGGGPMP